MTKEEYRVYIREWRKKRYEAGMCRSCGTHPREGNLSQCAHCRELRKLHSINRKSKPKVSERYEEVLRPSKRVDRMMELVEVLTGGRHARA